MWAKLSRIRKKGVNVIAVVQHDETGIMLVTVL